VTRIFTLWNITSIVNIVSFPSNSYIFDIVHK
jgi:hypothetical protein